MAAFNVQINAPTSAPVNLPIQANGIITGLAAGTDGTIEAMWYQIDGGDAAIIDFAPDGSSWGFQLANCCAGAHLLTVYARSTGNSGGGGNPPDIRSADQTFTVVQNASGPGLSGPTP
jgi:hypothetical protein